MLDASDAETGKALLSLFDLVVNEKKRLIFWIGAGASSWCGYPRWDEFAENIHSHFFRYERQYDKNSGCALLESGLYLEFFQLCQETNPQSFYRVLVKNFPPKSPTPVYTRFIHEIGKIQPLQILTTNVDELLEKSLPNTITVQRSDIERINDLVKSRDSFVCKLHGSVSTVESTVFTSGDYERLVSNSTYRESLKDILRSATILFVGYSLQDGYLLQLLAQNAELKGLFGDGPHFAILPKKHPGLPENVLSIRYAPIPHKDHRSSIQVIEEIAVAESRRKIADSGVEAVVSQELKSAHLLFDILPPGQWITSETANLDNKSQMIVGMGFSTVELPPERPTATHDLLVALLCFDSVYAPLFTIPRIYRLVGSELFWELVNTNALKFVHWMQQEGIIFPGADAISEGDLGSFSRFNPNLKEWTVEQDIRLSLEATSERANITDEHLNTIANHTGVFGPSEDWSIPSTVRGLLLRPSVRKMLGISGGTSVNSFARWQAFPLLRLAYLVRLGWTCQHLGIGSAKLDFGTAELAGPAFYASTGAEAWSDHVASYVLCGRFDADVGEYALQESSVWKTVLTFRNTQDGSKLRQEILHHLLAKEGGEVAVAVNGGLRRIIPQNVLQKARDQFVGLLVSSSPGTQAKPAVWNDSRYSDEKALALWRARSRTELSAICQKRKIERYDRCPCGSGDKLKFCCEEALREQSA